MNVHIILKKQVALFKWEMVPLVYVELEVVPKGQYVIDGVTYQTVGIPKFFIGETRTGHELNYVEIVVEIPDGDTAA